MSISIEAITDPTPNHGTNPALDVTLLTSEVLNRSMTYVDSVAKSQREYFDAGLSHLERRLLTANKAVMRVQVDNNPPTDLPAEAHPQLGVVLSYLRGVKSLGLHDGLWLHGPKGTGKSYLAVQAALALKQPYYSLSCTGETSASEIMGWINVASGALETTPFMQAWQHGGVFAFEEISLLPSDVGGKIMNAMSLGVLTDIKGQQIKQSPHCYIIASDNTVGRGGDGQYQRERQDAAFLDRFIPLYVGYTDSVDKACCPHESLRIYLLEKRAKLLSLKSPETVAPRAMRRCLMTFELGLGADQALHVLTCGWAPDTLRQSGLNTADLEAAYKAGQS